MIAHDARQRRRPSRIAFWVIDVAPSMGVMERLADARKLADAADERVGLLLVGEPPAEPKHLFEAGADHVCACACASPGQNTFVATAATGLAAYEPRIIFAAGDSFGRECACRLAARCGWRLISPTLMVRGGRNGGWIVTALDSSGKWARQVNVDDGETIVVTLQPGISAPLERHDASRCGTVETIEFTRHEERIVDRRPVPVDPTTADIRYLRRLVSGGLGLGGAQGFDLLRRIATKLNAGIAASRAVVDAGWIEYERQVGQTGKTVKPDLYLACGISGASHHLDGMSGSGHIIAINSDPRAPIHKVAHLGLVADVNQVLEYLEEHLR